MLSRFWIWSLLHFIIISVLLVLWKLFLVYEYTRAFCICISFVSNNWYYHSAHNLPSPQSSSLMTVLPTRMPLYYNLSNVVSNQISGTFLIQIALKYSLKVWGYVARACWKAKLPFCYKKVDKRRRAIMVPDVHLFSYTFPHFFVTFRTGLEVSEL